MIYLINVIISGLIKIIISGLIYSFCFEKPFGKLRKWLRDLYYFLYGFNDENFVEVKRVKGESLVYLLELKGSRFFDEILIDVVSNQKSKQVPIHHKWYDIDSIKYDAKREIPLYDYNKVSLRIKYVLKFGLFKKKEFNLAERLPIENGVKDSKLCYKIVFKE